MSNKLKDYTHLVAMTNDTTWTNVVPAGYELEKIVFVNSTGNIATLDLGKTSGANDVFLGEAIAANDITTVVINKTFSMISRQTLYLNDDDILSDWNGASITSIVLLRRVLI